MELSAFHLHCIELKFSPIPSLKYSCWGAAIITTLPIKVFYLGPARAQFGDKVTCWDGVVVPQLLVVPLSLLTCQITRRLWRLNPAVAPSRVNAGVNDNDTSGVRIWQCLSSSVHKDDEVHCYSTLLGKVLVLILAVRKDHITHFGRSSLTPSHCPYKLGMKLIP